MCVARRAHLSALAISVARFLKASISAPRRGCQDPDHVKMRQVPWPQLACAVALSCTPQPSIRGGTVKLRLKGPRSGATQPTSGTTSVRTLRAQKSKSTAVRTEVFVFLGIYSNRFLGGPHMVVVMCVCAGLITSTARPRHTTTQPLSSALWNSIESNNNNPGYASASSSCIQEHPLKTNSSCSTQQQQQ